MRESEIIRAGFRGRLGKFELDASFDLPGNGITALFGPSGCGKTTVLRCMAGLHRIAEGFCAVGSDVWQDAGSFRPPHRRAVGYVFQEASLFPHLSVRGNLLYGAPRGGGRNGVRFDEVADLLGLAPLLDREPRNLSGGERQRVAIGRALLSEPRLLLMDEPLSALDRQTKEEILPFLERLHESLSLPVIYVSHDMAEVEHLADHLVLMQAGRVIAAGPLAALQSDPALPLATSRTAAVTIDTAVAAYDREYGLATFERGAARFLVPAPPQPIGARRRLRIAASDVSLARDRAVESTILNILPVAILQASRTGDQEMLAVLGFKGERDGARLLARVTRRSWERLGLAEGAEVYAQIKSVALAPAARV